MTVILEGSAGQPPAAQRLEGGLLTAIAFEVLRSAVGMIIASTSRGPAGAAFGLIITVMMFINIVAAFSST